MTSNSFIKALFLLLISLAIFAVTIPFLLIGVTFLVNLVTGLEELAMIFDFFIAIPIIFAFYIFIIFILGQKFVLEKKWIIWVIIVFLVIISVFVWYRGNKTNQALKQGSLESLSQINQAREAELGLTVKEPIVTIVPSPSSSTSEVTIEVPVMVSSEKKARYKLEYNMHQTKDKPSTGQLYLSQKWSGSQSVDLAAGESTQITLQFKGEYSGDPASSIVPAQLVFYADRTDVAIKDSVTNEEWESTSINIYDTGKSFAGYTVTEPQDEMALIYQLDNLTSTK